MNLLKLSWCCPAAAVAVFSPPPPHQLPPRPACPACHRTAAHTSQAGRRTTASLKASVTSSDLSSGSLPDPLQRTAAPTAALWCSGWRSRRAPVAAACSCRWPLEVPRRMHSSAGAGHGRAVLPHSGQSEHFHALLRVYLSSKCLLPSSNAYQAMTSLPLKPSALHTCGLCPRGQPAQGRDCLGSIDSAHKVDCWPAACCCCCGQAVQHDQPLAQRHCQAIPALGEWGTSEGHWVEGWWRQAAGGWAAAAGTPTPGALQRPSGAPTRWG